MKKFLILLLILSFIVVQCPQNVAEAQSSGSISCGQSSCLPTSPFPNSVDIQEKATYSAIDLNFLGIDLNMSVIPAQVSKNVHMYLTNGEVGNAKNLTIDLSSSVSGEKAPNIIVIGDNFDNVNIKLNGYSGVGGKDASQICSDNIQSLKYGTNANLKYLQNRANPANELSVDRCGDMDVADLTTDKFACTDPNFVDVSSTQSISVDRVQKVNKCLSIVPQPICVQPAYKIRCDYDLWLKNINSSYNLGSADAQFNLVPDESGGRDTLRSNPAKNSGLDLNNPWKNSILSYKEIINDGSNGMFFWDIANYFVSTTDYDLSEGCNDDSFGATVYNYFYPYFYPYSNTPRTDNGAPTFSRSYPSIGSIIYFSQNSGISQAAQVRSKEFIVSQQELNLIRAGGDHQISSFCNGNSNKFPSGLAAKMLEVNTHIANLENTYLDSSAIAHFWRLNFRGYDSDHHEGCYGVQFSLAKYRSDMTYRARVATTPVLNQPGLDASGLRLEGGVLASPNTNADKSYTNAQGWKLDIMKGFAGSDPSSSSTLLQKTCNTNFILQSVESTNIVKYEDIISGGPAACSTIKSCDPLISNDPSTSCQIDPQSKSTFYYIGLDPDPQGRVETVNCSLTSCPVQNQLLESTRILDTLTPTGGDSGTEQGNGSVFLYDTRTSSLQSNIGQAGAGGKNDLASPVSIKYCAKKRDATTDPNSSYKNEPTVEFKRINWKAFDVQGGALPGTVPPFTGKKIQLYKKLDPGVLYLLKKELL